MAFLKYLINVYVDKKTFSNKEARSKSQSQRNIVEKGCVKMSDFSIVQTDLGKIRGIRKISALGDRYISFLGIRYAVPPLGVLRFKVRDNFFKLEHRLK